MRSPIKTIIFDWAGVFCSPGELYSHPRLRKTLGLSPAEIERRVGAVHADYYRGKTRSRDVWRRVVRIFKLKGFTFKELNAAYIASYRPYPEILAIPQRLKKRYTVALLSNLTDEMMRHIVNTHALRKKFHRLFFSNRVGRLKPEPEMFRHALTRLHAEPAETLFIDDSKENIIAARALGMQTLHVKSPRRLIADLKRLGIVSSR